MTNSLVIPMFYNQNGQKVNLENWMQNLETSVDTKIANLVTLNGVKNSAPDFWAPTTRGENGQVPQFHEGQMLWADPYYKYDIWPSSNTSAGFLVPEQYADYIIFMSVYDRETEVHHIGMGIAVGGPPGVVIQNAPVVVDGQNFSITRKDKAIEIRGTSPETIESKRYGLSRCAWLKLASE